jgi:cysteine synthase B
LQQSPVASDAPLREHPIIAHVGNTPLMSLERVGADYPHVEFLAKAEWFNSGGSVKDRPALNIILEAERTGQLTPKKTILDATSGNTGIAYAMLGAARGYQVKICLPANVSVERKRILRAFGAELVFTPGGEGIDGAIIRAREIYADDPDRYSHYHGTAQEIWDQTEGRVTHFVATLGTSGTFTGTTRRLKELNADIRCYSVQPDAPFHGLEGMKHMESALVPGIYDESLADGDVGVSTEDAYRQVRALARTEGMLIGVSSGAAVAACFEIAAQIPAGETAVIVTVFPDSADKYLNERFWEEEP